LVNCCDDLGVVLSAIWDCEKERIGWLCYSHSINE
jgi:hypothetical protein